MAKQTIAVDSVAEAYLALLADRGVDYIFGNAGTDFPSIIEALSKAASVGGRAPQPITVPHENVGMAMAHGYYLATGRPQAVMVHVNVGTANGICGVMNAARENVPILFTSGRTPITEEGLDGSRSIYIHWGQEMFDQAGVVREMVKWDYELRNAAQIETVVDRALNLAMTEPRGPIYLTLPREVLAEKPGDFTFDSPTRRHAARPPAADPQALERAATMLAEAENPLIITAGFGRDPAAVPAFAEMVERFALPVLCYRPRYLALPTDHPMQFGYEPAGPLKDADVILVLDCDVPWIPSLHTLRPETRVIHLATDPLFSRYPVRGFTCDLAITGSSTTAVPALAKALAAHEAVAQDRITRRRARVAAARAKRDAMMKAAREKAGQGATMEIPWVAQCLDRIKGADDFVVSESQLPLGHLTMRRPGTFFATGASGGLGWGLGAALGVKLGARDRHVFCVLGDGSYMFSNPTPAHFISAANDLPVLTIILNNGMWGSVRKATLGLYPDGAAARSNNAPFTHLSPTPDYHRIVEASGGLGIEVTEAAALPDALERALDAVKNDKRQAVVNVHTTYDDAAALADARR
jgi:acetolactate synthase I/II/III large subunit